MPTLIKAAADGWAIASETESADIQWQAPEDWNSGDALLLTVDLEPLAEYAQAERIAIEFPAFNDGRALSLAVLLRTRLGYTGELRAVGAVHEDILHYMVRCGFDAMEIPDDRNVQIALELIRPYSNVYQGTVDNPEPSFRRMQRG
ncbi:MAG: DUF934 domain-containing protein [Pseudomonadaceae bacterium]|nr:DUF934 domain-containing protein [Pseudomonadaceae bacterium]